MIPESRKDDGLLLRPAGSRERQPRQPAGTLGRFGFVRRRLEADRVACRR